MTQRLSGELRCRCVEPDEILDEDAPVGTVHDCPTCNASYILDNAGTWRNIHTLSARKRDKLRAIGRVNTITAGMD